MQNHHLHLPDDLPEPVDDGACNHLPGMDVPDLLLPSTAGRTVSLREASHRTRTVLYVYPRSGQPGQPSPTGWDQIPGARG